MSVKGKSFTCGNCKTEVTLTSEGTNFICPNCQTKNELPKENKNNFWGFVIICLIIYGVYSLFSSPKYGEFYSQDKSCLLSVESDDNVIWIMTYTGYNNHGKATFEDRAYGSLMAARLNDGIPLIAEWHKDSKTWVILNGGGYWGGQGTITLYKK